ncbi:MAG: GNAT family N-acetyltransferase [Vulcanibacillus sp.]
MISYVEASLRDFKLISDIEKQCFNQYDCFSNKTIKYFFKNPHNTIILDLIKYNENVAGYSVYFTRKNSKKIRLYSICISPEFRGKKIASYYLKQRIHYFSEYYFQLSLEVRVSNIGALKLYQSLGFQEQEILKNYYADGEDGLRLIKKLL